MKKITTIIFDLGGVILNLDQEKTINSFRKLGLDLSVNDIHTSFYNEFEKGLISEEEFRREIKNKVANEISDEQIDHAWNNMLLNIPRERIDIIKKLRDQFNVFLLSNTNSIHINSFMDHFEKNHAGENWDSLFNKIYYSHEIGMRKPDREIYDFLLKENGLKGSECIFIDDNKDNLKGAELCSIHSIWANEPLSDKTLYEISKLTTAGRAQTN